MMPEGYQNRFAPAATGVFLVIAFVTYSDTFLSMVSVWLRSDTYLHGTLILPMAAYLIWRDRLVWLRMEFRSSLFGLLVLGVSVFCWCLATIVSVQLVTHFAFIAMLVAIVWTMMGTDVVRFLHFPLLFTFFSVPFGEFLIPRLMDWTADFTVMALQWTGIPVLREGNFFALPSGNFEVIDACSGIRFLIVTVVLGLYFAHESYSGWKKRGLFLMLATATIVAANWIRAYVVVLVAHFSEFKYGTGQDHIYVGWAIFLAVIVFLFWAGRKYEDSGRWSVATASNRPSEVSGNRRSGNRIFAASVSVLAFFVLVIGPNLADTVFRIKNEGELQPMLPILAGDWVGPQAADFGFRPSFAGASHTLFGQYRRGTQAVEIYVFFYRDEQQGSELIGWDNRLIGDDQWAMAPDSGREFPVSPQSSVKEAFFDNGVQVLRVWHWYDIGGKSITSPLQAKFQQAWNAITGVQVGDAAIIVAAPGTENSDDSAPEIQLSFVTDNLGAIQSCLRPSGESSRRLCMIPRSNTVPGRR